jgi:hypothetical protein
VDDRKQVISPCRQHPLTFAPPSTTRRASDTSLPCSTTRHSAVFLPSCAAAGGTTAVESATRRASNTLM